LRPEEWTLFSKIESVSAMKVEMCEKVVNPLCRMPFFMPEKDGKKASIAARAS
jgi:hypothetical protein